MYACILVNESRSIEESLDKAGYRDSRLRYRNSVFSSNP